VNLKEKFLAVHECVLHTIKTENFIIKLLGEPSCFQFESNVKLLPSGREQIEFQMWSDTPARPPVLFFFWEMKQVDTQLSWHPNCGSRRNIPPNWAFDGVECKSSRNAPLLSLFNIAGENRLTFYLLDALNSSFIAVGVSEESGMVECLISLFTETMAPLTRYETCLFLDQRSLLYYRVLADAVDVWAAQGGFSPMEAPQHARLPVYSTWYSYHQAMEPAVLEDECKIAKAMGMEAIIVDDGWQTTDNSRGYAYCGDWEVTQEKFPDFKAHVARVHEIGLKYVVWFSVPFVGIYTKAHQQFKDMYLDPDKEQALWHILDPRFPEVRQYLLELYTNFTEEYDIDGFKLDFIDSFQFSSTTEHSLGEGRDIDSLAEAIDRLLTDVVAALKALKPGVLIEFRQRYIGPVMRKYGNMLRVGDVPNDFQGNRVGMVDVRLLAGNTPVHADMIMWHSEDSVESAAMQLVHTLFAVPQISVRLEEMPESHHNMLRFYLNFWREQQDVLLSGEFMPEEPGALYPVVQARTGEKLIAACYSGRLIDLRGKMPKEIFVVNGTLNDELLVNFTEDPGARRLQIWDCQGELLQEIEVDFYAEPYMIAIPPAGVLKLTEMKERGFLSS